MFRLFAAAAVAAIVYGAQSDAGPVGVWKGDSSCAVKESACREETVVYRLTKIPEKPGAFSVSADKIIDGKPINVGTLEFRTTRASTF